MNKAYRFFKLLLKRPFQWLYRTTVIGAENEPAAPYIACANHTSFADPFLEGLALREQVSYIAKASLQRFRIIRWFFKTVGVIPIPSRRKRRGGNPHKRERAARGPHRRHLSAGHPHSLPRA